MILVIKIINLIKFLIYLKNKEFKNSLFLVNELLNSESKEELYQEILKYEDKNINSPTLKEYLDYTKKDNNEIV